MLLACACAFSFNACSEDDEDVDVRDQAIGTYDTTIEMGYVLEDKIYPLSTVLSDLSEGEVEDVLNETFTATLAKSGNNLTFSSLEDNDSFVFYNIEAASNGFTFDVEDYELKDEDMKLNLKGYDGASLGSTLYNGLYSTSDGIQFYLQGTNDDLEDYVFKEITNDEEALAAIKIKIDESEELTKIFDKGVLVLSVSAKKK